MELNKIYNESNLETMKRMENDSIDCVITSPPYWQLRDYGYDGQWGLESTFEEYLENLWKMMDEIYRVLKPTGTVWINLGDTYSSTHTSGTRGVNGKKDDTMLSQQIKQNKNTSLPSKCLLLIPHRFAIGCISRGWVMRNDVIWGKRNGMPESVTDRFSKKHEYFFFMAKQENYFFDLDAIRDKHKEASLERYNYEFSGNKMDADRKWIGHRESKSKYDNKEVESNHRQGMNKERGLNTIIKRNRLPEQKIFVDFIRSKTTIDLIVSSSDIKKSTIEHWFRYDDAGFSFPSIEDWNKIKHLCGNNDDDQFNEIDIRITDFDVETDDISKNSDKGKNPSDVSNFWDDNKILTFEEYIKMCADYFYSEDDFWNIPTKPSSNKHYASYNDSLLVKPVLAGCPEGGIIYDPFFGTGSTGEVALRSGRKYIGSEMSKE